MTGRPVYDRIIEAVFLDHYKPGSMGFDFDRTELESTAGKLGLPVKNLGDIVYSYRFRTRWPDVIAETATPEMAWRIDGAGKGKYRFRLGKISRIAPREDLRAIKIPDATPEIISHNALDDEQALLAKIRYNRLVDTFMGITAYSMQNHLRTTVEGIGQIEIDEIYVGVNRHGTQFVVPVQAKRLSDKVGATQALQDIACCAQKFPGLVCRPVAAQFIDNGVIAMLELVEDDGDVKLVEERHYRLVPAAEIAETDLMSYRLTE